MHPRLKFTGPEKNIFDPHVASFPGRSRGAIGVTVEEFEKEVNRIFASGATPLVDGYAPFW